MVGTAVPGATGALAPVELGEDPACPRLVFGDAVGRGGGAGPDPAPLARCGSETCQW